ncbi:uncharacterized protein LOC122052713 [Zingiber officinale]|uniref:uncharacterized protein LOC122052713 n=1 Tax=Zingiber officinale TaxID=94328 RepID=UPI001C4CE856|nr:uncharacterized protein LOC122052713 [Zingiber officinale]
MQAKVKSFACLSSEYKKLPPENASASRIFANSSTSRNNPLANLFTEQNSHVPFSEQRAPKGEHNKLQTQDMKGQLKAQSLTVVGASLWDFLNFIVPLFVTSCICSHSEVPAASPTPASSEPLDLFFIRFFFKFIFLQISSHFCRNMAAPISAFNLLIGCSCYQRFMDLSLSCSFFAYLLLIS